MIAVTYIVVQNLAVVWDILYFCLIMNDSESYFLAFCIEQYKNAKALDGAYVASLFFEKGLDRYLSDNYSVLHTQSHQWLVEEIDEYLNRCER